MLSPWEGTELGTSFLEEQAILLVLKESLRKGMPLVVAAEEELKKD